MIETIYADKKNFIEITIDKTCIPEFLEIAEGTLWGTDSILYKMNDLRPEFDKFKNPIFVSLKENDALSAICVLNQKNINQNNSPLDAFYLCILSVLPEKMSKGYATLILNKVTDYIFNKFDRALIYAYVEEDNKRSERVFKKTYTKITSFVAPSHVCINPKPDKFVSKLDTEDNNRLLKLLNNQYENHSFIDINESVDPETYYVLKEGNEIRAGLQVKILRWSFVSLAGFEGFLMMKIVPKLPILKKIFIPKNHSFLKIGNIYFGDKDSFTRLLDSVLASYQLNTCLAYTNPNSCVDSKIISELKKGILSSVDSKVLMFYKAKNVSQTEIENPQFLSLADSI